ncbi:hypothetical protein Airi01_047450 [Actinoallomurus iriomotensis]|uniref:HTH cro/C1-type domain-containing protein n=1 Tax=Actinoallomurus iriomotensis TaxID=478107 RepID=A0A9W6VLH7_9ACTN|nr:hypothetical protein Airi01_047450 [Actinoallomurus iriomotensis]
MGALIRDARMGRDLTLKQLATASGVSAATVSAVERASKGGARQWVDRWQSWQGSCLDPRDTECPPARYRCRHGEFRVRLAGELSPKVWVELEDLPAPDLAPVSLFRRVPLLTRARLPVVPLTEIETDEAYARRVLDRVRELSGGLPHLRTAPDSWGRVTGA